MTPTEAEHLRDLFIEARKTARATASEYLTAIGMRVAIEDDDAAVEAFNTALKEATKQAPGHVEGCLDGRYGDTCPCRCHVFQVGS